MHYFLFLKIYICIDINWFIQPEKNIIKDICNMDKDQYLLSCMSIEFFCMQHTFTYSNRLCTLSINIKVKRNQEQI